MSINFCGDDKTVEVVLRTIISVNQLSNYGAVADMCDELACRISDCSERTGKLVALDNPETTVILTELMTTNKSPRTDENVQGNLLQNYDHKFANQKGPWETPREHGKTEHLPSSPMALLGRR